MSCVAGLGMRHVRPLCVGTEPVSWTGSHQMQGSSESKLQWRQGVSGGQLLLTLQDFCPKLLKKISFEVLASRHFSTNCIQWIQLCLLRAPCCIDWLNDRLIEKTKCYDVHWLFDCLGPSYASSIKTNNCSKKNNLYIGKENKVICALELVWTVELSKPPAQSQCQQTHVAFAHDFTFCCKSARHRNLHAQRAKTTTGASYLGEDPTCYTTSIPSATFSSFTMFFILFFES